MAKAQSTDPVAGICFALILGTFVGIAATVVGCGGSPARHFGSGDAGLSTATGGAEEPMGTGGGSASGGAMATGGSLASGGGSASGGRPATGGDPGSGGVLAVGGHSGTGGAASGGHGSGGAASGGSASGGAASGGRGTGGAASGGSSTGGAATGGNGSGGMASGGAGTGGAATGGAGTGGAGTGGAGTGGAGTGGVTVSRCRLLVNEIQTGTLLADSDEYVELYNSCSDPLDVSGYSLNYRSAGNNSGGADIALYIFPAESKVGGGGFIVLAGAQFSGGAGGRFRSGTGLSDVGGAVAVRNASGAIVDSVAYDALATDNNFTEGFAAPNPPKTSSIARSPNGTDTDNNSRDFQVSLVATPGATNL